MATQPLLLPILPELLQVIAQALLSPFLPEQVGQEMVVLELRRLEVLSQPERFRLLIVMVSLLA